MDSNRDPAASLAPRDVFDKVAAELEYDLRDEGLREEAFIMLAAGVLRERFGPWREALEQIADEYGCAELGRRCSAAIAAADVK